MSVFVLSRLDCRSSTSLKHWKHLKWLGIMPIAFRRRKADDTTPILRHLPWLQVRAAVDYKMVAVSTIVFTAIPQGTCLTYGLFCLLVLPSSLCLASGGRSDANGPFLIRLNSGILFPFLIERCRHLKPSNPALKPISL